MKKILSFFLTLIMMIGLCGCGDYRSHADIIVQQMTLEEKIGQMIMPSMRVWDDSNIVALNDELRTAITEYNLGGIMLHSENCSNTDNMVRLVDDIQRSSRFPLLIGIEQEGGSVANINEGTNFCGNLALTATGDSENAVQAARAIGNELKSIGINVNFAPNGIISSNPGKAFSEGNAFSDTPQVVAEYSTEYIHGLHSSQVASVMKYFPGIGDLESDEITGFDVLDKDYSELKQIELVPYKEAIRAKTDMIQVSNVICTKLEDEKYDTKNEGVQTFLPAALSKKMITNVLRKDMHFNGIVVTDSLCSEEIANNFEILDAASLAINAGADILFEPVEMNSVQDIEKLGLLIDELVQKVKAGIIDEDIINESVVRIIEMKLAYGLMRNDGTASDTVLEDIEQKMEYAHTTVGKDTNTRLDIEISKQVVTLLKNDNALPEAVNNTDVITVFMPYGDDESKVDRAIHYLMVDEKIPYDINVNYCIMRDHDIAEYYETISFSTQIIVISALGSFANMNPESERGWQSAFVDKIIENAHDNNKKVILISSGIINEAARYQEADAICAAYCDQNESNNVVAAIYKILSGEEFTGRIPVDIYDLDEEYQCDGNILYNKN